MALTLHELKASKGSRKTKKRVGRGLGSTGTTAGRGQKGQKARAGSSGHKRRGMRRTILSTPKLRGFNSPHADLQPVNVGELAEVYKKGDVVSKRTLFKKKLIASKQRGVKILGRGEIDVAVTIKGCSVSKVGAEKVMAAGGKIEA